MGSGLVMLGIVAFVMVAQGILWSWVFLERRRKIPDVKIMSLPELAATTRQALDTYYRQRRESPKPPTVTPRKPVAPPPPPRSAGSSSSKPAGPGGRPATPPQRPKGKQ